MTDWTDWIFAAFTLAVAVFTVYLVVHPRRGWRAWDRFDKINYALISAAVWPWLTWGWFGDQPRWLDIVAGILFLAASASFIYGQWRFLRQGKALLAAAEEAARRLDEHLEERPNEGRP